MTFGKSFPVLVAILVIVTISSVAGSGCPQGLKICGPPDEPSCCKYCPHVKNC
ncbi:hypothetical protein PSTG_08971 [Puccinia striiformis f. sp. tritici PST-78]|uniref:Uncharacterized protein n=1 Tax=Puccinia striiformis f. sp. tritici PST-78 TaxID=1165861 RepID=A0A0L0VEL7_9BASI|nr:hypothetical protein PSTG_08971 [Puccinia striiformis f. sp. tritici PST-78]